MPPPSPSEAEGRIQRLIEALECGGDWLPRLEDVKAQLPGETWAPEASFQNDSSMLRLSIRGVCELLETQRIGPVRGAALLRSLLVPASTSSTPLQLDADRWEQGEILGLGGMGEVRSVHDHRLGRAIAVKRLLARGPQDHLVQRFIQEARITAQLEHPNIVPIYDLQVEDGRPVLSMRIVRGNSLRRVLDDGEMPVRARRLGVFKKVCDAIAYAHSRGVVHRDLKADNVMVGEFGEVQVMDWGLAWRQDDDEPLGSIAGTPTAMAPEQARGETDRLGPTTDVYALGILLYELVCDVRPYRGETIDVLDAVRSGRFASPRRHRAGLERELEAIVLRAMAPEPEGRFQSVADLRAEIEAFEQGLPIRSLEYSAWARGRLWLVRHRQRVVPVALTVAVAVAAGIMGLARYATDLGVARDDAMVERDRAVQAEQTALERVVAAQLAGARAAMEGDHWYEARSRWLDARSLAQQLDLDTREADLGLAWAAHQAPPPLHSWTGDHIAIDGTDGGLLLSTGDEARHIAMPLGTHVASRPLPEHASAAFVSGEPVLIHTDDGLVVTGWDGDERVREPLDESPRRVWTQGPSVLIREGDQLLGLIPEFWRRTLPASGHQRVQWNGRRLAIRDAFSEDQVFAASGELLARTEYVAALIGDDWLVAESGTVSRHGVDGVRWTRPTPPIERAEVSPDGALVALVPFDPEVPVLDATTGDIVARVPARDVERPTWVSDRTLVTLGGDGVAEAWPIPDAKAGLTRLPRGAIGMSFSPSGDSFVVTSWGSDAWLVDRNTGRVRTTFHGPHDGSRDAQFSRDGTRVWLAGRDGVAWGFDVATGEEVDRVELDVLLTTVVERDDGLLAVGRAGSFKQPDAPDVEAHPDVIWELEWDRETDRMLTTGRSMSDAHIRLWDADLNELMSLELGTSVYRGDLQGDLVAAGLHDGRAVVATVEGEIQVEIAAHHGPTMAVALHHDLIATTGYDLGLHIYDNTTGAQLLAIQPFTEPGVDLEFSDDGRWLVGVSGAGEMVIFDLERDVRLRELVNDSSPEAVAASLRLRGLED